VYRRIALLVACIAPWESRPGVAQEPARVVPIYLAPRDRSFSTAVVLYHLVVLRDVRGWYGRVAGSDSENGGLDSVAEAGRVDKGDRGGLAVIGDSFSRVDRWVWGWNRLSVGARASRCRFGGPLFGPRRPVGGIRSGAGARRQWLGLARRPGRRAAGRAVPGDRRPSTSADSVADGRRARSRFAWNAGKGGGAGASSWGIRGSIAEEADPEEATRADFTVLLLSAANGVRLWNADSQDRTPACPRSRREVFDRADLATFWSRSGCCPACRVDIP
jgi:hypothetical protein